MTASETDDLVALTKTVRASLRAELKRTGVTAAMLLGSAPDLPKGLDVRAVNRWMNGLLPFAAKAHLDYMLARWAALPAHGAAKRGKSYPIASGAWIEVTDAMSKELRAELARTGRDHATLLNPLADVPSGLTTRIVKGWLYRHAATTRAEHWAFVMNHLNALPDMTTPLPPLTRRITSIED